MVSSGGLAWSRLGHADGRDMLVERNVDLLHLLQHLDAALRLARLGRLGAEAVDEALQMLARGFLLLGEGHVVGAL